MISVTLDAFATSSAGQFNVGDVVTVKAGGPRMTVTHAGPVALVPGEWLICQWFDEHGELRQEMFAPDLVRSEPRSIPAGSVQWRSPQRALYASGRTVQPE